MDNQITPQEHQGKLEEVLECLQGNGERLGEKHIEAVSYAHTLIDEIIEAGEELPPCVLSLYGSAHDAKLVDEYKQEIIPILAKYKLRVEELDGMLKLKQDDWLGVCEECDALQSQNKKLEEEVKRVSKHFYDATNRGIEWMNKYKQLQSQLSALKEEKVCEHDWQAEWVKSYTTSSGGTKMRCKKCLEVRWIYD